MGWPALLIPHNLHGCGGKRAIIMMFPSSDYALVCLVDDKELFDARDIHRIRKNNEYVYKFVRQVAGDENKAYNMLVRTHVLSILVNQTYFFLL